MTCVLASPWSPFRDDFQCSPMNPDTALTYNLERQHSHGYASSGSDSRKPSGSSGKKRASRAGTRSVTTLSAAQLERKRANDREAQRAIRQRTKDHIDSLEKSLNDLRGSQESKEKLVTVTQQRNHELEEENAYLRSKLSGAGYGASLPNADSGSNHGRAFVLKLSNMTGQRPDGKQLLSVHSTSPAAQVSPSGLSIQRPSSTSSPRSLSAATSLSSNSRHGSFQQQSSFVPSASLPALPLPSTGLVTIPPLTAWRSHDSGQGVQSMQQAPIQVAESSSHQPPAAYGPSNAQQPVEWTSAPQPYPYPTQEPQQTQRYETQPGPPPPPQQQQSYVHTPVQAFAPAPPLQAYHPPQLPPQAEFQNMAVSSPAPYQMHHQQQQQGYQQTSQPQAYSQQSFQQPPSYQMTPIQMPVSAAEYASPHGQMQPPAMSTPTYHAPPQEQHYAPPSQHPQAPHPPLQYSDNAANRGYSVTHYPPG